MTSPGRRSQNLRAISSRASMLSPVESVVMAYIRTAVSEGRQITRADIAQAMGSQNHDGGTAPGVLNRLERKGLIQRTYYQRGVQVCLPETGQCTLPPRCLAPHWRLRPRTDPMPTPAIHKLRERSQSTAMQIEQEARALGKSMAEFAADLVYIGWHGYQQEQANG